MRIRSLDESPHASVTVPKKTLTDEKCPHSAQFVPIIKLQVPPFHLPPVLQRFVCPQEGNAEK